MQAKIQMIRSRDDEMDTACGIKGAEEKSIHGFGGEI
jgi:hypothetical protein